MGVGVGVGRGFEEGQQRELSGKTMLAVGSSFRLKTPEKPESGWVFVVAVVEAEEEMLVSLHLLWRLGLMCWTWTLSWAEDDVFVEIVVVVVVVAMKKW